MLYVHPKHIKSTALFQPLFAHAGNIQGWTKFTKSGFGDLYALEESDWDKVCFIQPWLDMVVYIFTCGSAGMSTSRVTCIYSVKLYQH